MNWQSLKSLVRLLQSGRQKLAAIKTLAGLAATAAKNKLGGGATPSKLNRVGIHFLVACILAFALEQVADKLIAADQNSESALAQSVFDVSGLYQQLVTAGPRKPISHFTVIVEIDRERDPVAVDILSLCKQRPFIGDLLQAVASANPAVIVLDKYFDSRKCLDNDDVQLTKGFIETVKRVSKQVPIVTGENVETGEPNNHRAGNQKSSPKIEDAPPAFFPHEPGMMLYAGIVNIDRDTRRLPLRWILPARDRAITERTASGSTLALQAALQFDLHLLEKNARLQFFSSKARNPYTSFLDPERFTHFYAGEILCKAPDLRLEKKCAELASRGLSPDRFSLRDLSHRIVLIGERVQREDHHHSVVGDVPGFYLQANYIEALLDDRLYRPVNRVIDYVLGFLIFAVFEFILYQNDKNRVRAVFQVLLLLLGTAILLYMIVVHSGYYLNPATVSLLAILINLGHLLLAGAAPEVEKKPA